VPGFATRYGCKFLVCYELHSTMLDAIAREKQLKGGSRKKKLALIEASNPTWRDLYGELIQVVIARSHKGVHARLRRAMATKQSRAARIERWIASLRSQ
jgi:hypothetical protein